MSEPSTVAAMEETLSLLKREVDTLQVEVMSARQPWYRQASVLIAFVALVFSLGTTAVSYYRTAQQDLLSTRQELRGLVERLSQIPAQHAKMLQDFDGEPRIVAELSGTINNRNLIMAQQASAAIHEIEGSLLGRGTVLADEYIAVAMALMSSFKFDEAGAFHQTAAERATDPATAATALRSSAGVALARQDVETMRERLTAARAIFEQPAYQSAPQITQDVTNATTELQWAQVELTVGDCARAQTHLANADPLLRQIPPSPLRAQLAQQMDELAWTMRACS